MWVHVRNNHQASKARRVVSFKRYHTGSFQASTNGYSKVSFQDYIEAYNILRALLELLYTSPLKGY